MSWLSRMRVKLPIHKIFVIFIITGSTQAIHVNKYTLMERNCIFFTETSSQILLVLTLMTMILWISSVLQWNHSNLMTFVILRRSKQVDWYLVSSKLLSATWFSHGSLFHEAIRFKLTTWIKSVDHSYLVMKRESTLFVTLLFWFPSTWPCLFTRNE